MPSDKSTSRKQAVQGAIAHPVPVAARIVGVSVAELYNRMNAGDIAAVKLGKRTLVPDTELRRYLASLPAFKPSSPATPRPEPAQGRKRGRPRKSAAPSASSLATSA
jgi:hypothetical protein